MPARSATQPAPRPGRRSRRRSARCVRTPARSAARGRRRPPGRPARRPAPPPRDRRSPRPWRSRQAAHRRPPGRGSPPGMSSPRAAPRRGRRDARPVAGRLDASQALAQARERAGRREQRWQRGQVWQAVAARLAAGVARRSRPCAGFRRSRLRWQASRVLDLGVDCSDVEVDLIVRRGRGVSSGEVGRDPFGDPSVSASAATQRRIGHGQASVFGGRIRRQPVRVRRMPSASGGPSTSPAAASRVVSAGRNSNML